MKSLLTKIAGSIAVAGVVVGGVMLKTNDCPIKGDSPQVRLQHLDSLKNRYPSTITPTPISFDALAKETDQTKVVSVEGYVLLAKSGNGESCNCHTTNKDDMDIHIEIVKSLPATNKDAIICEITRFSKGSYTLKGIEALKGKKVRITELLDAGEPQ